MRRARRRHTGQNLAKQGNGRPKLVLEARARGASQPGVRWEGLELRPSGEWPHTERLPLRSEADLLPGRAPPS